MLVMSCVRLHDGYVSTSRLRLKLSFRGFSFRSDDVALFCRHLCDIFLFLRYPFFVMLLPLLHLLPHAQDERRQLLRVLAEDVRALGGRGVLGHVYAGLHQRSGEKK